MVRQNSEQRVRVRVEGVEESGSKDRRVYGVV